MSETPLITIGIACFNAEDTIERALESALGQTWSNTDILVVDDHSTDSSRALVEKVIEKNGKVRMLKNDVNRGVGFVRQRIVENAKGDFLAFFDDDDFSGSERIRVQYEKIVSSEKEHGNQRVVCHISGERRYPNGYVLPLKAIGSDGRGVPGEVLADRLLYLKKEDDFFFGGCSPTCSMMARKSTLMGVGGFDPELRRVEDVDISIRIGLMGGIFVGLKERLFVQYATSASDKSPEKNMQGEIAIVEKNREYLKKKRMFYYARHWPLLRYYHFKSNYILLIITLLKIFLRHPLKTLSHASHTFPRRIAHEAKMRSR